MFMMLRPQEVNSLWPVCRDILQASFQQRVHVHSVDDYYPFLLSGHYQLWIAIDREEIIGAVVSSLEEGSNAKICNIMSLAGKDLTKWIGELDSKITEFAKLNGCYAVEAVTRKGFSRYVPDFVEDGMVYVKLTGVQANGQIN